MRSVRQTNYSITFVTSFLTHHYHQQHHHLYFHHHLLFKDVVLWFPYPVSFTDNVQISLAQRSNAHLWNIHIYSLTTWLQYYTEVFICVFGIVKTVHPMCCGVARSGRLGQSVQNTIPHNNGQQLTMACTDIMILTVSLAKDCPCNKQKVDHWAKTLPCNTRHSNGSRSIEQKAWT